jgi:hypothetical protein
LIGNGFYHDKTGASVDLIFNARDLIFVNVDAQFLSNDKGFVALGRIRREAVKVSGDLRMRIFFSFGSGALP